MGKHIIYKIFFVFLTLYGLSSCSSTKYIANNEYLLERVKVKVNSGKINTSEVRKNVRQKPNTRILGVARFHLGLYNLSGRNEKKRFNKWLRSIGEAPVVYSDFLTDRTAFQMKSYLNNKGYYDALVTDTVVFKKKKAYVRYDITPGEVTTVSNYHFRDVSDYINNELPDSIALMQRVLDDTLHTLLRRNMPLDMEILEQERERITKMLKEDGYFNFSKNFIQFYADTAYTGNPNLSHVFMGIQNSPADSNAYRKYEIGNIDVNFDYDPMLLLSGKDASYRDSVVDGIGVLYRGKLKIKPNVIIETIQFKQGEFYNVQKVIDSYSRLQALNLFKSVDIKFEPKDLDGEIPRLDCHIRLTPLKRQSYNVFLEGTNNSGNIGVGGNFTYNHRNLFKGAENIRFSVWGALKKERLNEKGSVFSTKEIGAELKLVTPQFWMPVFWLEDFRRNFAPKTSMSLSYSYENTPYYSRQIGSAKFGYLWRKSDKRWRYNFDLVDFNYVLMKDVDAGFINGLINEYVKSAYTDHMILSANFSAIFSDQQLNTKSNFNYFRTNIESAGNLLLGLDKIFGAKKITTETERYYKQLGVRYAQYVKMDGEYRFNHYINKANTIVYRMFLGGGYPYGNMKVLPFEEAFYCGGANDIRAWQMRTLGPGSYSTTDRYPNSVGDFKLEVNIDYRFKLFWLLEGALFVDAGNIWNINKFEDRPGTMLGFDFYKQIAVGTGAGLRLNMNFFLLRFDWGIKMCDPSKPEKQRFVLFDNGKWMKNTVFNIAIGYPF